MPDTGVPYLEYVKTAISDTEHNLAMNDFAAGKAHILMNITYLSPNYLSLRALATVASLTRLGNRVSLVLNDSNISTHKSVLQNNDALYYIASGRYMQQIIDQMARVIEAFGGSAKDLKIVKASDIWSGIVDNYVYFADFYRMLGKTRVYGKDFENGEFEEAYHIIDKPFNAFVFANYAGLTKSDFGMPDYLIVNNKNPEPYRRAAMLLPRNEETRIDKKILSTHILPALQYEDIYPSCYMELSQINHLLGAIRISKSEVSEMYQFFIHPMLKLLTDMNKTQKTNNPYGKKADLGYDLYAIFNAVTKLIESSPASEEVDMKISSPLQANNVRKLLASKRIVQMLRYCNGEYTIAEIAKKANLQLSNASLYMNKLRESGLVSADKRPRLLVSSIVFPINTLIS